MDNNQQPTTPPQPVTPQPVQPPTELPNVIPPQLPTTSSSNKMILWLLGGIVVALMIGAGIYWYMGKEAPVPTVETINPTPSTKVETFDSMDQDLNSIDAESSDSADFDSVNSDLEDL